MYKRQFKKCDSFICDDCRDEHNLSDHGILRDDPIEETPLELTCGRCHVVGARADRPMKGIESLYICGAFETGGQGCQAFLCRKCQIPHAREVHPIKEGDPIGDPLFRCGSNTRCAMCNTSGLGGAIRQCHVPDAKDNDEMIVGYCGDWVCERCDVEHLRMLHSPIVRRCLNVISPDWKMEEREMSDDMAHKLVSDCLLYTSPSPRD